MVKLTAPRCTWISFTISNVTRSRCSSGSSTVARACVTCSGVTFPDFFENTFAPFLKGVQPNAPTPEGVQPNAPTPEGVQPNAPTSQGIQSPAYTVHPPRSAR